MPLEIKIKGGVQTSLILLVYFAVISWVCKNQTNDIYQYIAVDYVRDVDLFSTRLKSGWSGGAMVLGKLPVPTILITVGQGPISLAVSAGGGG